MHAVRGGDAGAKYMVAVKKLRGREPVFFHALVVLLFRLRQVELQTEMVVDSVLRQRVPELIGGRVLRVDGRFDLNAPVIVAVPLFVQRHQLLTGGEALKIKIVAEEHTRAAAEVHLHAALGKRLRLRLGKIVHLRNARHAEAQALRDAEQRRRLDAARVEPVLARENVVVQPACERYVVRVAAQDRHRQMRMRVHQSRHEHHAAAVDNSLRLLLRRFFGEPRNFAVRHADERVRPETHPRIHRQHGDVGKQCIHTYSFSNR